MSNKYIQIPVPIDCISTCILYIEHFWYVIVIQVLLVKNFLSGLTYIARYTAIPISNVHELQKLEIFHGSIWFLLLCSTSNPMNILWVFNYWLSSMLFELNHEYTVENHKRSFFSPWLHIWMNTCRKNSLILEASYRNQHKVLLILTSCIPIHQPIIVIILSNLTILHISVLQSMTSCYAYIIQLSNNDVAVQHSIYYSYSFLFQHIYLVQQSNMGLRYMNINHLITVST